MGPAPRSLQNAQYAMTIPSPLSIAPAPALSIENFGHLNAPADNGCARAKQLCQSYAAFALTDQSSLAQHCSITFRSAEAICGIGICSDSEYQGVSHTDCDDNLQSYSLASLALMGVPRRTSQIGNGLRIGLSEQRHTRVGGECSHCVRNTARKGSGNREGPNCRGKLACLCCKFSNLPRLLRRAGLLCCCKPMS